MRRGTILCIAVVGFGAWINTPTPGEAKYGDQQLGTRCVVNQTSSGDMVAAQTTWRVWSGHGSPDGYRWQARLIPNNPGLNFVRPWNEVETHVVRDGSDASSYDGWVTTPPMSWGADWNLEVKLTWDRENQRDYNVEHVLDFDEGTCAPALAG
jgi:hypothetical protein